MRVRVLGAGIVGLACAEELLRRGHDVILVDPTPGRGASYAAAGMLSPAGELWHGEDELFRLGRTSAGLWPEYAARLGVALQRSGTLLVGLDHGDLRLVERQIEVLASHGERVEELDRRGARALEPTLSTRVSGGVLLPDDHSVDPREVVAALLSHLDVKRRGLVPELWPQNGTNPSDLADPRYDVTVVATGAVLPPPFAQLVRRVRGEAVRVRATDPPTRVVRGWVHGEPMYAVPRAPLAGAAEVVVGATSEEHDEAAVPTVRGVARLLDSARAILPGLEDAEFAEVVARDRPGTPDNLPLVGPTGLPGVFLAAGHYRHGVLLAPLTARLLADAIESGRVETAVDPRRFPIRVPEGSRP